MGEIRHFAISLAGSAPDQSFIALWRHAETAFGGILANPDYRVLDVNYDSGNEDGYDDETPSLLFVFEALTDEAELAFPARKVSVNAPVTRQSEDVPAALERLAAAVRAAAVPGSDTLIGLGLTGGAETYRLSAYLGADS